jgi:hypothetical protein
LVLVGWLLSPQRDLLFVPAVAVGLFVGVILLCLLAYQRRPAPIRPAAT